MSCVSCHALAASVPIKRLFVRVIYTGLAESGLSLSDTLMDLATGSYTETSKGKFITGSSAAGRTVSFQVPPAGRGLTQLEVAEIISELLDLYDETRAALVAYGTASPTDAQIYAEMMDRLQQRRVVRSDFSGCGESETYAAA